jgi:predicted nucleic acid-binding protein
MTLRAFLDTSALFAAIWSPTGGGRVILKLGETGSLEIIISAQVLKELENTIRNKAAHLLGDMAIILHRSQVQVAPKASPQNFETCLALTNHPGDAQVIADAWEAEVDYLVSLDQKHILINEGLRSTAPFPIGTPGDFLQWVRAKFTQ